MRRNLVLTRKIGESINIGNDVTVTVVKAEFGAAKLAVLAEEQVQVDRAEITARRNKAQRASKT